MASMIVQLITLILLTGFDGFWLWIFSRNWRKKRRYVAIIRECQATIKRYS